MSRRRSEINRAVWVALVLVDAPWLGNTLGAADLPPAESLVSNAITASLEYQQTDHAIINWGVSLRTQTVPFPKEPPAASGRIIRGVLDFGGDSSNSIAFIWQRDAGKLFLDLNRNRDLTDDSKGAFSARDSRLTSYQTFTNVHLLFNTAVGRCPVLADLHLYDYGARPSCIVAVRSFWEGKVTLNGRDWQTGLVQSDATRPGSFGNGQLLLRPWANRNQPFSTSDGSLATVPFSPKLYMDGHAYHLGVATETRGGEARPALQFAEQSVSLGEMKIAGKFIQRLVLPGGPYLVVLDQPTTGTVKVPVGSYSQPNVFLASGSTKAYCTPNQQDARSQISVNGRTPSILDAGGPLTNSVLLSRQGQDLRLDYRLVGAGGATYQLVNRDTSKPPTFAIYKGDRKIASDNFQFG